MANEMLGQKFLGQERGDRIRIQGKQHRASEPRDADENRKNQRLSHSGVRGNVRVCVYPAMHPQMRPRKTLEKVYDIAFTSYLSKL